MRVPRAHIQQTQLADLPAILFALSFSLAALAAFTVLVSTDMNGGLYSERPTVIYMPVQARPPRLAGY